MLLKTVWASTHSGHRHRAQCATSRSREETTMLWTIVAILLILWLLGFSFHVAGGLVHILLVVALVVIVFNLLSGRRSI